MDAEVLLHYHSAAIGAACIGQRDRGIATPVAGIDSRQSGGRGAALDMGSNQRVASKPGLGPHSLDERVVTEIDLLLAQPERKGGDETA